MKVQFSKADLMAIAERFSKAVGGSRPKYIGKHRWSEANESAVVTTYSPNDVKVVCVVTLFKDHTMAVAYFSSEDLSGFSRFESITHFLYKGDTGAVREMVNDLKWVWKTVDEYSASWESGANEIDD